MRRVKLVRWAAVLAPEFTSAPGLASAQDAGTLNIGGAFRGSRWITIINGFEYPGMCGADLVEVYVNGHAHSWTLTLRGVSSLHNGSCVDWNGEWRYGDHEPYIARAHSTSFDFPSFGPEAAILDAAVIRRLSGAATIEDPPDIGGLQWPGNGAFSAQWRSA